MGEYSAMKVPELKKLLGERGLTQTGNKADLIARLEENDKTSKPARMCIAFRPSGEPGWKLPRSQHISNPNLPQ